MGKRSEELHKGSPTITEELPIRNPLEQFYGLHAAISQEVSSTAPALVRNAG
jgi:hypothetical protein